MSVAAVNALVRVLLAPSCAVCSARLEQPLDGAVCRACVSGIRRLTAPLCVVCAEPLDARLAAGPLCLRCEHDRPAFASVRYVGRYEGALRQAIHVFKYGRRRALAEPMAGWLADAGSDLLSGADAVVPVPLHWWRRRERGFNQADELARLLGPPVWRVLRRVQRGRPQAGLPAHERRANVHRAFALCAWRSRATSRIGTRPLRNAVVVLVDDVMTTGATLDACSRVLVDAGVRRVSALTVARSVPRRPARLPARPGLWAVPRR